MHIQIVTYHPYVALRLQRASRSHRDLRYLLRESSPKTRPHLYVIDMCSAKQEFAHLTAQSRKEGPPSKFIALQAPAACNTIEILRLLYLGADGIVTLAEKVEDELPVAVRAVIAGRIWAPREALARWVRQTNWRTHERVAATFSLTARENQVLQFVMRHIPNGQIAEALRISERTVKFHVANLLAKTGAHNRGNLVAAMDAVESGPETMFLPGPTGGNGKNGRASGNHVLETPDLRASRKAC